ncbi:hypothetical protein ED28_00540 [[Pantoea] beijingensis]|uniref:EAL domain-containing protein n=2 Tax=[Pantoea] beijingensis TaxID=1324864 RepID=A0A443IHG4_9GAMM|nr:hypothetical protein ED28_00540 [[Pantoea] beijingensis]
MKIDIAEDYHSLTAFYPVYSFSGHLLAVEVMTHYMHKSANVAIPQEILFPQMTFEQQLTLLKNQINVIEKYHDFFIHHQLHVGIKIDEQLAWAILESEFLLHKMGTFTYLELELSESLADFSLGRNNPLLAELSERFFLSLGNFGAGKAPAKAVYDNLFYRIKLDKGFIQHNITRPSFFPFMNAILNNISPHCQQIIVQGIDDLPMMEKVRPLGFSGIQSSLFRPVGEESLPALIYPPQEFFGG